MFTHKPESTRPVISTAVFTKRTAVAEGPQFLRYRNFLDFFNMAAVHHFGFVCGVFGPPEKATCWSLSLCKVWLRSMQ